MAEKEYIEREAANKKLDHFQSHLHTVEGTTAIGVAKTLIEEIPPPMCGLSSAGSGR